MLVTRRGGDDYFEMDTIRRFETARAFEDKQVIGAAKRGETIAPLSRR